ncbi:unnamed protein product [marine sediment metagenome]|uniref:Uncharacterized protein n=1 Tax=marine sediment metagenome TaxID=412755 RepID=X0VM06_9ZZZZ
MAQIIEEKIVITLARIARDDADANQIDSVIVEGVIDTIDSVVQELVADGVVVEIDIVEGD